MALVASCRATFGAKMGRGGLMSKHVARDPPVLVHSKPAHSRFQPPTFHHGVAGRTILGEALEEGCPSTHRQKED